MVRTSLRNSIEPPWTALKPIRVGTVPSGRGTPNAYVTVERDGEPYVRIDAYGEWDGPFQEVIAWDPLIVLGWGDAVHVVDPVSVRTWRIACSGYFGHLYPLDKRLLIASASELVCVNQLGEEVWRRGDLGLDGVVVDRVAAGLIEGRAEWDPPGGWHRFRLALENGEPR